MANLWYNNLRKDIEVESQGRKTQAKSDSSLMNHEIDSKKMSNIGTLSNVDGN